jgi:3-oxoacyl-[acyl-carrier-protein] synthase-3
MCSDTTEACTSGSVALFQARNLIETGTCKCVLVVCSEKATTLAPLIDYKRSNLFGDASFAVLLRATNDPQKESFDFFEFNSFPYDGNLELIKKTETGFFQDGPQVHKFVLEKVVPLVKEVIVKAELDLSKIKHLVFHQPSPKTINSLERELFASLPDLQAVFHKSQDIGNASSASFGHLLSTLYHQDIIKPGEKVWTYTFGAGLSIGIIGLHF